MKLFSKMLTRKPDPEEAMGKIDLDMDVEPLRRRSEAIADDTGEVNPSKATLDPSLPDPTEDLLLAKPSAPVHARDEEPEEAAGAGWGNNAWGDESWDDDDDWGDEDLEEDPEEARALEEKAHLVGEIREAMGAVSHVQPEERRISEPRAISEPRSWANDEEFGRKALARNHLGGSVPGAEDRLLQETDNKFTEDDGKSRRSAMAHLKAAAKATKADRVLKQVVGRDMTADPDEQSPYRDDLAKVVRPRSTSRPISRPVSRPRSQPAEWDQGTSDDDAAMFAASSEESLMPSAADDLPYEDATQDDARLIGAPDDMSAEDFADDNGDDDFFARSKVDGDDTFGGGNRFASDDAEEVSAEADDEGFEDDADDDGFADDDDDDAWGNRFAADDDLEDEGFEDEPEAETPTVAPVEAAPEPIANTEAFDDDENDGPVPSRVVSEVVAFANAPHESGSIDDDEIVRQKIAGLAGESGLLKETTSNDAEEEAIVNVGAAITGRAGRKPGRVKTRLLGFQANEEAQDIFETAQKKAAEKAAGEPAGAIATQFPVGWIVVIEGPGRGACFTMYNGVSNIGRGEDQAVRLDFGDTSISRNNHAAVAYDDEQGQFFLGHGGKSNLVRLNGSPVLSTETMTSGDEIRIGETALKFVSLCGEDFTWKGSEAEGTDAG